MQEEMMEHVDPEEKDGRERLSLIVEYIQKVRRKKQVLQMVPRLKIHGITRVMADLDKVMVETVTGRRIPMLIK